jgi:hypothetical protein
LPSKPALIGSPDPSVLTIYVQAVNTIAQNTAKNDEGDCLSTSDQGNDHGDARGNKPGNGAKILSKGVSQKNAHQETQ